eukprot:UN28209
MGWYHNNCAACLEHEKGGFPKGDIKFMSDFGFDGTLKLDGCGPAHNMTVWAELIKSSKSETINNLVVENCANNGPNITWTAATPKDVEGEKCDGFHMYRIAEDISNQFYSTMYSLQRAIPFLNKSEPLSRPGCWAYLDMLMVGKMKSPTEEQSHFGAWCIVSSPIVLGFDLANADQWNAAYPIISNEYA